MVPNDSLNTGSFNAKQAIHKAEEERQQRLAASKEKEVIPKKSDKPLTEDEFIDSLIKAKQLPEEVDCVAGKVPYRQFKKLYSKVYDHIASGDYLLENKPVFNIEHGPLSIVLRTITEKEEAIISNNAYSSLNDLNAMANLRANSAKLALSVLSVGNTKLPTLSEINSDKWWDTEEVVARMNYFSNLDSSLFTVLIAVVTDVTIAKLLALREVILNPK